MAEEKDKSNLPPLSLHVPEPRFRPGDKVDYSDLAIPKAGAQARPDIHTAPKDMRDMVYDMIRVLDDDDQAVGPWDPKLDDETLLKMLRTMVQVRTFDDRLHRQQRQGKTSFYMKCTGEEATSVAATMALHGDDMCFPSYRQQGILFVRGYPMVDMVNQIFSNKADKLKGRQLPIMYSSRELNFFSVSGNLTTQYPQAVGWAMASASKGDSRIAAVWCGEGSTAEGDFHAAMTFAAVYNAPVIMNVVNNQWAISSFSGFAGAERTTFAARGAGYGIAALRVDGNDPLAVYAATSWAAERARTNQGPTLIEHFAYRADAHSTSDDPTAYRSAQEREEWPLGDPIMRLNKHLIKRGVWSVEQQEQLDAECLQAVKEAVTEAAKNGILGHGLHQPFETMFQDVFEEMPWHLKEQAAQANKEREIKWPS